MPVVPWKTRKRDSELIAKLYRKNQQLKEEIRSVRYETLHEIRDLIREEKNITLADLRDALGMRIESSRRPTAD